MVPSGHIELLGSSRGIVVVLLSHVPSGFIKTPSEQRHLPSLEGNVTPSGHMMVFVEDGDDDDGGLFILYETALYLSILDSIYS